MMPNPQLGSQPPSSYGHGGHGMPHFMGGPGMGASPRSGTRGGVFGGRPRHIDDDETDFSDGSESWDDQYDRKRSGGSTRRRGDRRRSSHGPDLRRRSMDDGRHSRFRDPWGHADSASDSESDSEDDNRSRRQKFSLARRRSVSRIRDKAKDMFGDSDDERTGNTQMKKWGATMAGALAGGLAAQQVGKMKGRDHWVPTALGAFMGGFATREAEKLWFKRKADVEERNEGWEAANGHRDRGRDGKRSRSQGW